MRAPFSRTLHDLLDEQAGRHGDAVAVIDRGLSISYAGLRERAGCVSAALRADGVRFGDRIGLIAGNRLEWVEICFGISGAGGVTVPFSTWSTQPELEYLIADSGITTLFAMAAFGDRDYAADLAALAPEVAAGGVGARFPNLRRIVLIEPRAGDGFTDYAGFIGGAPALEAPLPPGEAASAVSDGLILYTSGSSARPKAVKLRQAGIVENGFNIGERQGYGPNDKVLLSPPLFWSYGSANCMAATLSHGATLVLQEKFNAAGTIELIERHGCTALYTLPGITNAVLRDPGFSRKRVATLRTGLTIGSPQDVIDVAEKLGAAEICNIYGATETYGNCCVTWHHWPLERRAHCQGPPLPGNELRFVDPETGEVVAHGEPGLTEVRGHVMPGYSGGSADQNAVVFSPDGFYRTGDVGRLDEHGAFVFIGRSTEMIKRAGINISPAEIEEILLQHPSVELAGVVGASDRERGERVVAFVVLDPGNPVTEADLLAHCGAVASKYKLPDRIEIRTQLPQTPTGKLLRRDLKQEAAALFPHAAEARHG